MRTGVAISAGTSGIRRESSPAAELFCETGYRHRVQHMARRFQQSSLDCDSHRLGDGVARVRAHQSDACVDANGARANARATSGSLTARRGIGSNLALRAHACPGQPDGRVAAFAVNIVPPPPKYLHELGRMRWTHEDVGGDDQGLKVPRLLRVSNRSHASSAGQLQAVRPVQLPPPPPFDPATLASGEA